MATNMAQETCEESAAAKTGPWRRNERQKCWRLACPPKCSGLLRRPFNTVLLTEPLFRDRMGDAGSGARRHAPTPGVQFVSDRRVLSRHQERDVQTARRRGFRAIHGQGKTPGRPWCPSTRATRASCCAKLPHWSQSIGFAPHRDFTAVERIFGDVSADASEASFRFGRDGKPVYIPGPMDTARSFGSGSSNCANISATTASCLRRRA